MGGWSGCPGSGATSCRACPCRAAPCCCSSRADDARRIFDRPPTVWAGLADPDTVPRAPRGTRRDRALVAAAFAALVAVAAVWLAWDRRPPEWDHANHLERAVVCAPDLVRGDGRAILERSTFYPPLLPCAAGLVFLIWPSDAAAAQAVVLLFLGLGLGASS